MKRIAATILRNIGQILSVLALSAFVAVGSAFADISITKTFEFGPGTAQSHSNVRTFPVPCGMKVQGFVKFTCGGVEGEGKTPSSSQNDVPIKIDFREPDLSQGEEGPIINTVSATTKRYE